MNSGERPLPGDDPAALQASIREGYTRRLDDATGGGAGCCGQVVPNVTFEPAGSLPSFGCGDPHAFSAIAPGETVVDLGCGAGLDALRAAASVGPEGRVIGVDMTPAMVAHARAAAERLGLRQASFLEGRIESLPLPDESADVVISNCVLNLSADVDAVLREALRVLQPGGRLRISDTFRRRPAAVGPTVEGWCACVDGAHDPATLLRQARHAGFVEAEVVGEAPFGSDEGTYAALLTATRPDLVMLATTEDVDTGADLLAAAGLPTAGWAAPGLLRWGARRDGVWVGIIALERHGAHGLVRSWAVAPAARGMGYGGALVRHVLRVAAAHGLLSVVGLTTTVAERLAGAGFRELAWDALPPEVHASDELRGACPRNARAFIKEFA